MSETRDDELAARLMGLSRLSERTLFAVTWPASPDAVRTLTNSDGEQAMPLFSGLDTLESAAQRFGWLSPDGSLSFRELAAHDALHGALAQGVHFVVFDIQAPHATEFSREEVERVMRQRAERPAPQVGAAAAGAASSGADAAKGRSRTRSGPLREVTKAPGGLVAEIDLPFTKERTTGQIAAPPRAATAGADPRRELDASKVAAGPRATARRADARPVSVPPAFDRSVAQPAAAPARARAMAVHAMPVATELQPQVAAAPLVVPAPANRHEPPMAVMPARVEPKLPTLPSIDDLPSLPSLDELPELELEMHSALAEDAAPDAPVASAASAFDTLTDSLVPEAKPAALEAAVRVAEIAKLTRDPGTRKAAAEVGAMLKDMARKGSVEEDKPTPVQSAAKALAGLLSGELAADAARLAKRARRGAAPEPKSEPAEPAAADGARPNGGFSAPTTSLGDEILNAIADALRKYPEVEWACEVSDGGKLPVVGVRVDPAFLARVPEIEAAVFAAGQAKAAFAVLILRETQQMKDARSQGSAFFPWRKRAAAPKR